MNENTIQKLNLLAESAKYDVSCSSSGNSRANRGKGIGNTLSAGICHSFTADGRCISLLKILMSNHCIYDCAYCINRRSNDHQRATLTPEELVDITIGFYRRNYIEGLFLSSGVIKNPDYTMERMMLVAKKLRTEERYNGYIHLKAIPGASEQLINEAGKYADRMSVNIEIPTNQELKKLAPEKNHEEVFLPMNRISSGINENREALKKYQHAHPFVPAGQSTQLIVGATPESDQQILTLASNLYEQQRLKRVYYSGYLPVNSYDKRLPVLKEAPLVRENRLYQSDWLMRFYRFSASEIVSDEHPFLDLDVDPKLAYALRNYHLYPVDVNRADYEMILRVPGIGVQSAQRIIQARRFGKLTASHLKKIGVVMKRAQYFITNNELPAALHDYDPARLKVQLLRADRQKRLQPDTQLKLFDFTAQPNALLLANRERFITH
jgi:putative DNA modification/repair radical SAM protein